MRPFGKRQTFSEAFVFLNEELIAVINSRSAWCLVGSGASAMAGAPTWAELATKTLAICNPSGKPVPQENDFQHWCKSGKQLPRAFAWLVQRFSRPNVESAIDEILRGVNDPGPIHTILASWNFAGYATSNFDRLIEDSLKSDKLAWETVGNSAAQNQLISRDASQMVWHLHGVIGEPEKNLRLVLANEDYDELYSAGSPTASALESLLRWKRVVIVGFGFRDSDLMRVFDRVKRVTNPAMPAFAFVANKTAAECREFRDDYNVETLTYKADGNDHRALLNVLSAYSAFAVTRNITYSVQSQSTPSYATDVTSILTSNCLLRYEKDLAAGSFLYLARAWTLNRLAHANTLSRKALTEEQPAALQKANVIDEVLNVLRNDNVITITGDRIVLTEEGRHVVERATGEARRMEDLFKAQIHKRVENLNNPALNVSRITNAATGYFVDLGKTCGTGIAQRLATRTESLAQARQVALLQSLHSYMSICGNHEECLALIEVAKGVLSNPTPHEKAYLGSLAQSYFGEHVLQLEPESLRLRQERIASSVFILDANVVIHFLAKGSRFHAIAKELVDGVLATNGSLLITDALLTEVRNHAKWRIRS